MNYIRYTELLADSILLASMLPISRMLGVIGIPRSGMLPATIVANQSHLPLYSFDGQGNLCRLQEGRRKSVVAKNGIYALIDDSCYSGKAMVDAIAQTKMPREKLITCTLYGTSKSPRVDYTITTVEAPRFFQWNIMNHPHLTKVMCDMDGIICYDPKVWDDDGAGYLQELVNAVPFMVPRRFALHTIITHRLEKWQCATERWLKENGAKYTSLVMCSCKSPDERRATMQPYGKWKGNVYAASSCELFLESSEAEAAIVHQVSQKPVIAIGTGRVFC